MKFRRPPRAFTEFDPWLSFLEREGAFHWSIFPIYSSSLFLLLCSYSSHKTETEGRKGKERKEMGRNRERGKKIEEMGDGKEGPFALHPPFLTVPNFHFSPIIFPIRYLRIVPFPFCLRWRRRRKKKKKRGRRKMKTARRSPSPKKGMPADRSP